MKLRRGIVRTYVTEASNEALAWLSEYLTIDTGRRNHTTGEAVTFSMFHGPSRSFLSGYFPLVARAAQDENLRLIVEDTRPPRLAPNTAEELSWLRDDQRAAVETIERLRRGVVNIPTGGGKTEVFFGAVLRLDAPHLLVVDSADLMEQAAARWEKRTGRPVGRLGNGQRTFDPRLTCATFGTLRVALGTKDGRALLSGFRVLHVDECQTLPAETHYAVASACTSADYRIGYTATLPSDPQRLAALTGLLGPVIYRSTTQELTAKGLLSRARVAFIRHERVSAATLWPDAYRECVVENAERNRIVAALARRCPKPALVFVRAVEHGNHLLHALERAGLRAAFMWGKKSPKVREATVQRLIRGDLDVVVCNQVWFKGVDIPPLASAINAAGGAAEGEALQRLGRGTRVVRNARGEVVKGSFDFFDFFDTGHPWMEKHSRDRRRAYREEGHEVVWEEPDPAQLSLLGRAPAGALPGDEVQGTGG